MSYLVTQGALGGTDASTRKPMMPLHHLASAIADPQVVQALLSALPDGYETKELGSYSPFCPVGDSLVLPAGTSMTTRNPTFVLVALRE
jgi:hypothetical protein